MMTKRWGSSPERMPSEVMTAVQTELTTTSIEEVGLSSNTSDDFHDKIITSTDDELTQADLDSAEVIPSPSSPAISQIPVITSADTKKKPYGGRPLRFQCPNCERRFHAPSHLKRHMLCHTSERPFQCHICNKGFLQAWHLGRHMTTHTGNKPFNCPECPKTFGSRFEMKTHCNYIHRGIKEHECPICKKMFTLRSNLKVHMRKHTGEKPYECHVCSKKFGQRGHLQYHLRKHEGIENIKDKKPKTEEQQIIVDVENDADSQTVSYDSGVESVTSEYQPTLKDSSKALPRQRVVSPISRAIVYEEKSTNEVPLSGRMFDHTNPQELKPFVCVSCNCGFGEISSLRAHVRHSHLRKGIESGHFSCAHCHMSYNEIDGLKKHFEENHKTTSYIQPRSPVNAPVSPSSERKIGKKYRYDRYLPYDYEPALKRSLSQSIEDERLLRSPGGLSTSSDITDDRHPYIRKGYYMQCPPNCDCEYRSPSPESKSPESKLVQSRYLTYLEQYQNLLESHVQLMEALQVYRKQ